MSNYVNVMLVGGDKVLRDRKNQNFENFGNCSHEDDQHQEKIENKMHKT